MTRTACVLLTVPFVQSIALSSANAELPHCSWKTVRPKCERPAPDAGLDLRSSTSKADGVLFNYFLIHKAGAYRAVAEFNKTDKTLTRRALKLAEDVRKRAIRAATDSRPKRKWTAEQSAIVQRLETVRISIAEPTDLDCFSNINPGTPQAAYVRETHTVKICPSLTGVNSEEIESALAHELGHTISPCAMALPLLKRRTEVDVDSIKSCLGAGDVPDAKDSSDDSKPLRLDSRARDLLETKFTVSQAASPIDDRSHPKSDYEKLAACGIMQPFAAPVKRPSADYTAFSQCVESQLQTDYENWLQQEAPPSAENSQAEPIHNETPLICFPKAEETFADAFTGKVLSLTVTEKRLKREAIGRYLHAFSLLACRDTLDNYGIDTIRYPSPAERVRLQIETEQTSAALGCQPGPSPICRLGNSPGEPPIVKSPPPAERSIKRVRR